MHGIGDIIPKWGERRLAGLLFASFSLLLTSVANADETGAEVSGGEFGEVTVTSRRSLKDIGLQKFAIDSAFMRDNVSLSMADVIGFNSALYVKSAGRATVSTVSFRGTAPSHTSVRWNGMEINSPALGSTDFSLIPAYFVDKAVLIHGASAVASTSGALGGLVELSSRADKTDGIKLQYVQGIGSFTTFDEFLRFDFGNERWETTTRTLVSTSKNDFPYTNHDRKNNIYDNDHNIIGSYYPREKNRNGAFSDIHLMQDVYYYAPNGNRFALNAWLTLSTRNTPMLTTDYASPEGYENRQRERTLRTIGSWEKKADALTFGVDLGYVYSRNAYNYSRDPGNGIMSRLIDSRTILNSANLRLRANWLATDQFVMHGEVDLRHNDLESHDDAKLTTTPLISHCDRNELSVSISADWQPTDRLGLGATLRNDLFGGKNAFIPALYADFMAYSPADLRVKASVARNHHFPTLYDLYYLPGGNPNLKSEKGVTYDLGAKFALPISRTIGLSGSATWFQSFISDWILWLPDMRGFFSPRNVREVKSYGIETNLELSLKLPCQWRADLGGALSWTPSVNNGSPISDADKSVGKQLPYIPRLSSSAVATIGWRSWELTYKFCYYSRRFTMSSNEDTFSGALPRYYMSDVSLAKSFGIRWADFSLKLAVNNIFDADYQTIMSRPMPGINFEIFICVIPKF